MGGYSSCISAAVAKKFNEKQHMGGQDLFSLPFQVMVHDSGEVKTGTQATGHFTSIVKRKERINAWILDCMLPSFLYPSTV